MSALLDKITNERGVPTTEQYLVHCLYVIAYHINILHELRDKFPKDPSQVRTISPELQTTLNCLSCARGIIDSGELEANYRSYCQETGEKIECTSREAKMAHSLRNHMTHLTGHIPANNSNHSNKTLVRGVIQSYPSPEALRTALQDAVIDLPIHDPDTREMMSTIHLYNSQREVYNSQREGKTPTNEAWGTWSAAIRYCAQVATTAATDAAAYIVNKNKQSSVDQEASKTQQPVDGAAQLDVIKTIRQEICHFGDPLAEEVEKLESSSDWFLPRRPYPPITKEINTKLHALHKVFLESTLNDLYLAVNAIYPLIERQLVGKLTPKEESDKKMFIILLQSDEVASSIFQTPDTRAYLAQAFAMMQSNREILLFPGPLVEDFLSARPSFGNYLKDFKIPDQYFAIGEDGKIDRTKVTRTPLTDAEALFNKNSFVSDEQKEWRKLTADVLVALCGDRDVDYNDAAALMNLQSLPHHDR